MLKNRRAAAQTLAHHLFETETAIDLAIAKMAQLTGQMPMARQDANLSAVVGQDALEQAAKTLSALVEARSQIVETHHRLAVARDQIGLREMMGGEFGGQKPPAQGSAIPSDAPGLVLVKDAA